MYQRNDKQFKNKRKGEKSELFDSSRGVEKEKIYFLNEIQR